MDLSQVTLTQMRYAIAVEEARSFRRAAEKAHVSQSGLSMQIQKLEELLDVVLFDRSRKPVLVTDAGADALAQMRVVLRETERLGQIVAAHGEPSGPHRLGVIPTLAASVLPLFLRELVERYPQVELSVEELKTEDIIARLQADTLDAGIAATPLDVPGLKEAPLGYEALYAYLPDGDPLLKKKSVTDDDLRGRELWVMPEGHCFRTQVLSFCERPRAVEPRIHFESGSFQTLMRLVDDGLGTTVLPALVVRELDSARRERVRPMRRPIPVREIGLVTARTELRKQVNDALTELIREKLGDVLGPMPKRAEILAPV